MLQIKLFIKGLHGELVYIYLHAHEGSKHWYVLSTIVIHNM